MRRYLITFVIGSLLAGCHLFAQPAVSFSDTIPYTIEHNKMIIEAKVNGQTSRFIFDTGGRNMLVADTAVYHNVLVSASETVGDVNSFTTHMYKGNVEELQIGEYMTLSQAPVLITPNHMFYRSLRVAGILGGEAFANVCVTIDSKQQAIILDYPYRPRSVPRNEGIPMRMGQSFHSILPVRFGSASVVTLFDTGMNGFLSLSSGDYSHVMEGGAGEDVAEGNGFYHVGVGGLQATQAEPIRKITITEFDLGGKKFRNVGTLVMKKQVTILGVELIQYGKVILDYPRSLFFFLPYDTEEVDLTDLTKEWNIKILPIVDHFEVTAVLGETAFSYGDRVWNINGTDLKDFPMDEPMLNRLMDDIEEDEAWILVGDDPADLRKVTIKRI